MIRVTGGTLRGRILPARVPPNVRPTASRVREAIFSMVGQDLSGWSVLDLFGGSGLMAIEAASRGASPVTVVDRNAGSLACIRANVAAVSADVKVLQGDAASTRVEADLVYLDPPFKDPIGPWIQRAAALARRMVVAEARAGVEWPEVPGFAIDRAKVYGDTAVALYVRVGTLPAGAEDAVVGQDRGVVEHDGGGERVEREPAGLPGVVPGDEIAPDDRGGEDDG
ncbi:MAG: RsmD family RNA methyltransferase [Myxococcota bacterium]